MKIWYSYKGVPYKGDSPIYFDLQGKPWYVNLNNNLCKIQNLTLEYLNKKGINIDTYFNKDLVQGYEHWKISPFLFWGVRDEKNISKGKCLYEFFEAIPGLSGLAISILPAHTAVKPHYGDTDAVYRIHIPIKIPAQLPICGLRVAGKEKGWKMEELISFCDAHLHEAWNQSSQVRIVMIVDVVREECIKEYKNICLNVRSLLLLQSLFEKYKVLYSLPGVLKGVLRYFIKFWLWLNL